MKRDEIVEVKIKKRELHWIVWFVPLLALVVGGWMLYRYYAALGPTITITFENSGGLEPKRSIIRFRDVKVGMVEKVKILTHSKGVLVVARMNKDVAPFLNENTRFWIVKPEIGLGKVRGLDALMSGAYIQMESRLGKRQKREFVGLEEPPLQMEGGDGSTFKLVADSSYDLSEGVPVYYRQLKVGRVKKIDLSLDAKRVYIYLFIKKPYDSFINSTTKFWNLKSITYRLGDDGIHVEMGSLSQFLLGGVEFFTKDLKRKEHMSLKNLFYLYPSKEEALKKRLGVGFEEYRDVLMQFDTDSGYLHIKDPIKMDGFDVGYIKDITASINESKKRLRTKVIASLDLSSFRQKSGDDGWKALQKAIEQGLRAQIVQDIPFLKNFHIELRFSDMPGTLGEKGELPLFPTMPKEERDLTKDVQKILQKIEDLPMKDLVVETKGALQELRLLLAKTNEEAVPQKVGAILRDLDTTLQSLHQLIQGYSKGSLFHVKVEETLKDIDRSAKDLDRLLKKLDKKPNILIFGE